jgi:hypothetical protein
MRIIVAIMAVLSAVASATAGEIRYTLTSLVEHGALNGIAVEMVLTGEADGETAIELPDAWGGKSELWRGISEFRVSGQGLKLDAGGSPALKVLRHRAGRDADRPLSCHPNLARRAGRQRFERVPARDQGELFSRHRLDDDGAAEMESCHERYRVVRRPARRLAVRVGP